MSGPDRAGLTVALAERGIPALAIDITPYAVALARSSGALALQRDVFGRLPGTGRWETVLLADGNIGIGGDPAALLRRARDLLAPHGAVVAEARPAWRPAASRSGCATRTARARGFRGPGSAPTSSVPWPPRRDCGPPSTGTARAAGSPG